MHRLHTCTMGLGRLAWPARIMALALAWPLPGTTAGAAAPADRGAALLAEHAGLQAGLRDSPFGEPLLLRAGASDALHTGDVMAVLPRPLASVSAALRTPASVCGLLILHLNVRDCQPVAAPASAAGTVGDQLQVSAGPMRESLPGLVYGVRLGLLLEADTPGYFSMQLQAPDGPLGSSDLRVRVEAVALDASQTYLHIRYSQASGLAARMAARLYLATAGRSKIGFTSDGLDADGQPRPVGGERGGLERNVMRHYLALLAYSGVVAGTPAARLDARLRAWHALTERHAAQLHEMDLAAYLAEKQAATAALR